MTKTKLTYELIATIANLKGDGLTNKDICNALGITETTLYRWLGDPKTKLHRALYEEMKKAESAYKQTLLNTIRDAALAKNSNWTAAAWLLERKYPEEYTYWAWQTGVGRIVLVLYTKGGAELEVPAHAYAADLVVMFRDAATRTREAFDAQYDFSTLFNTTTSGDPRPDLSAEGVEYVSG